MPNTWTFRGGRLFEVAKRNAARYAIKAGIIALGGIVAVGTLHRTTYLDHTPLMAKVAAADSAANARMTSLIAAASPSARVRRSELDAGIEHPRIDQWVSRLSTTMSGGMAVSLGRMQKYADMIGGKLAAKSLPRDLIYLAMIESEFNPNAKSPVKAVGLWQFMKGTAKQFGLTVRGGVDERKDPARATDAAVQYLADLHERFGSWYLAAAAYNSGEGTVQRALKKVTGKTTGTDDDFFKILPVLPKETQDYVPKLIAASRIGNAPAQYGITPKPPTTTMVAVAAPLPTKTKVKVKAASSSRTKTRAAVKRPAVRSKVRKTTATRSHRTTATHRRK